MSYFGNSVPKIYTTHEDYKTVVISVHDCQSHINTAEIDGKVCFSVKIMISTSKRHVEHPFAGRNAQHPNT